jgi:glycosyltransferase involved in cell wall biosynthesis
MIAYACDPQGTGEHWLGWGWAEQAAHTYAVDLITTPRGRPALDERARALGITPHYVEVPAWLRGVTERLGGSWLRKLAWQRRAARLAAELHEKNRFAVVHQTTFHTFRVPFLSAGLGIPSVWGPIAGGEHVPPGFERYLGRARFVECGRRHVNRLWLQNPSIKRSLRQTTALLVSNRVTLGFLPATCRAKCQIVPPNALRPEDEQWVRPPAGAKAPGDSTFKLLYVGNCVATRAIPLVLEALRQSTLAEFELTVVGGGPALEDWKRQAADLGLAARVRFAGKIPYAQL